MKESTEEGAMGDGSSCILFVVFFIFNVLAVPWDM